MILLHLCISNDVCGGTLETIFRRFVCHSTCVVRFKLFKSDVLLHAHVLLNVASILDANFFSSRNLPELNNFQKFFANSFREREK